ncbi:MAG: Crp/Fnr family transcriptional regulator [Rhodobacteraceae bacterium]|nr:Crp/Fnr family transcriptional regulator [Paracoccaceae bacterium]
MPENTSFKTKCGSCPLRKMKTFRPLDEKELGFVSKFKTGELTVDAGATILLEGNKTPHLYTILEGWAFRHKSLANGQRQVLNFGLPGDLVGLQLAILDDIQHTVTALTKTTLCVFQRDKIWSVFKENPSLAYAMTWMASREEQMVDAHLLSLGQRNALARLSYLILYLHDRAEAVGYATNHSFNAPFTQAHFSDALGITPVHTSRTIKKLHEKNLINWKKDQIQILNREKLEKLAYYDQDIKLQRPLI